MTREVSLYLDGVRFLAALLVFLGHFATQAISGGVFWQIAPLRHDAVIVFFVLSGFVIAHAVGRGETDVRTYIVNRAARIYSVAAPAIAISLGLTAAAQYFDPNFCAWGCSRGPVWAQFGTSMAFVNQVWGVYYFPGANGPFWSLGYEVPYYAAFGLAWFARGIWRTLAPLAVMAAAGPDIAILFPVWFLGVGIYRAGTFGLSQTAGWALFLVSLSVWTSLALWTLTTDAWILDFPIAGLARERLPADYATALVFAANVVGFRVVGHRFAALVRRVEIPVRWLAARTFTLYLLHFPIMKCLSAFLPWGIETTATRLTTFCGTLLAVAVAAQCFELNKQPWRQFFHRCADMFGPARQPPDTPPSAPEAPSPPECQHP